MTTSYQEHVRRWKSCRRCLLAKTRSKVVLARGVVPCDVLFVGEAPGPSEDVLGKPFAGPAGKLLDKIIDSAGFNAVDYDVAPVKYALTNLVCCIPLGDDGDKVAMPPVEAIEACKPRLLEFVGLCKPRVIIGVGALAEKWLPKILDGYEVGGQLSSGKATVSRPARGRVLAGQRARARAGSVAVDPDGGYRCFYIVHPAAILRMDVSQQGLAIQRCIVTLAEAIEGF